MWTRVWTRAGASQGAQGWGSRSLYLASTKPLASWPWPPSPLNFVHPSIHSFIQQVFVQQVFIYYPSAGKTGVNETELLASEPDS